MMEVEKVEINIKTRVVAASTLLKTSSLPRHTSLSTLSTKSTRKRWRRWASRSQSTRPFGSSHDSERRACTPPGCELRNCELVRDWCLAELSGHTFCTCSCSSSWVCPQDSGAPLETVGREQPACLGANSECACEINTRARARAPAPRATHTQSHTAHRGAETRCTSSLHHESRTAEQPAVAARARDMCICEHAHQSCFPRARRTMHAQLAHLICSTSISARYGTTVRALRVGGGGCMCCGGLISLCTEPAHQSRGRRWAGCPTPGSPPPRSPPPPG